MITIPGDIQQKDATNYFYSTHTHTIPSSISHATLTKGINAQALRTGRGIVMELYMYDRMENVV